MSLKHINIALVTIVILALTFRIYSLNRINFDIDNLNARLAPFAELLKPNSKIGFTDSTKNPVSVMEVEFILVPHITVSSLSPDTLLTIQYKTKKVDFQGNYRVIRQQTYDDKVFSLITRVK